MTRGDPVCQKANRDDAGIRMIAPSRSRPTPQSLVEQAVVSRCVRDSLIENRNFSFIVVCTERLKIDIGGQRSFRPEASNNACAITLTPPVT